MASIALRGRRSVAMYGNLAIGFVRSIKVDTMLPIKHSIAVLIRRGDEILSTHRPDNDDELPGIWGLPAATARGLETAAEVISRIGHDKLGVKLTPTRLLVSGTQNRHKYRLEMELWEVSMEGQPSHSNWRWASLEWLGPGKEAGSLCCELAINSKSRAS